MKTCSSQAILTNVST